MTDKLKGKAELLGRFRYPFIILIAGVLLLLLPSGSSQKNAESDSSVVVVCEGAANPKVRLDIIRAVESYTGYSSDKITILRMTDKA